MQILKSRQILILLLVIVLCIPSFYFMTLNGKLNRENKSLEEKSKILQIAVETVEEKNQDLINKLEKDKKNLKDALESIKRENETIAFSLKKLETQTKLAIDEKTYLEEMLINKTKEIDALRKNASSAPVSAITGPQDLVEKIKEKDEEIKGLQEQNKILIMKLDSLYKTTNEKIAEINVAKIALEETILTARKKIEDEWNTVNLGAIKLEKEAQQAAATGEKPSKKTSKKEGRVLAINEDHGFVVVDLGKVDNIQGDSQLLIQRGGQPMATLSILEVRDVMSACNIQNIQEGYRIKVNDTVAIKR